MMLLQMLLQMGLLIVFMTILLLWLFSQLRAPRYNGLLWHHPNNGGGMELIRRKDVPSGHKPYYINFHWYDLNSRPVWLWYEGEIVYRKAIEEHAEGEIEYRILPYEPKPDPVNITPNHLFDNIDWSCAQRFESVKNKVLEAVKLGISIAMAAICVLGIIMVADMIAKKPGA